MSSSITIQVSNLLMKPDRRGNEKHIIAVHRSFSTKTIAATIPGERRRSAPRHCRRARGSRRRRASGPRLDRTSGGRRHKAAKTSPILALLPRSVFSPLLSSDPAIYMGPIRDEVGPTSFSFLGIISSPLCLISMRERETETEDSLR